MGASASTHPEIRDAPLIFIPELEKDMIHITTLAPGELGVIDEEQVRPTITTYGGPAGAEWPTAFSREVLQTRSICIKPRNRVARRGAPNVPQQVDPFGGEAEGW